MTSSDDRCPCGSGSSLADCCGPLLDGTPAATAERLMRSRYTAYALGRVDHLLRSWAPETRPRELTLDPDLRWRRLQIVDTARGGPEDAEGIVEFRASYRSADGHGVLHERSRFRRSPHGWLYVDGLVDG